MTLCDFFGHPLRSLGLLTIPEQSVWLDISINQYQLGLQQALSTTATVQEAYLGHLTKHPDLPGPDKKQACLMYIKSPTS